MKRIFYACLTMVAVLSGCSSGKSTFERGNYYEAVITSVNRLRKNNDHKKSVETLRQAYPLAVTFYEDRAKTALASNEQFRWSEVVKSYTLINNMYDEIRRCPGALAVVPNPVNYFSKLQEARQNAAEESYAAGILSLQGNTREDAKVAYGYFKTANDYVPGYKEVNDYLETSLSAATVKILVEPIPVHSKTVGVSAEFFNDKVSEFVHGAAISEFVRFYTRAEAQKIKLNPDHIIQLSFDDFVVGEVNKHEREIQLSKDSVVMGTYISPVTAQAPSSAPAQTTTNRSDLVGTGALVSARNPVTQTSPVTQQTSPAATSPVSQTAAEAEKERAARALEDKRRLEEQQNALAAKQRAEQEAAEKERLAKAAEAERLAKEAAEKAKQQKLEQERLAKAQAEKALADRARIEKERAERERAAKEAADKALAEKEKAENKKLADASIKPEDTLNISDPVTVCHIPPGNPMNARTLKINRSALKAHLAHGDSEGTCDTNKKEQKEKSNEGQKGNSKEPKGQQPEKKGKGPGGSAKVQFIESGHPLLFDASELIVASADMNPTSFLRYLSSPADTNKVYGTVKATLYHHTKTTISKGVVSFKIVDAKTGALLAVEKMPGEFVWKSEWATFNGDERALSASQLALTKQKELPAPAPQELFIEFTRPIYDQITSRIREFYKGY